MRLTFRLAMMLLAVTGPVEAMAAERCGDSHEVGTASLRRDMIGKAKINGEVITGVLLNGLCSSGFGHPQRRDLDRLDTHRQHLSVRCR